MSRGGAPEKGTLVGEKYLVGETLATGGMGCLVHAEHVLLEHEVAIKFVLDRAGRSARARLLREARAMRALTSEHVVDVFDLGVYEGAPYIVMELLEGTDLRDLVEDFGPMAVDEAVDCVIEAGVAVAEAHAMGIVHRDIKPANLFLAKTRHRELVKVLDFGISKVPEVDRDDDIHATTEDTVLGTPHFMSPEQLRNPARIDGRTDVWALGVTLFYLLTGDLPFVGRSRREITAAIFADEPLTLSSVRRSVPAELSEVIAATLVKRPKERTPTVRALIEALVPFATKRGRDAAEQLASSTLAVAKTIRVDERALDAPATGGDHPGAVTAGETAGESTEGATVSAASAPTTEGGLSSTLSPGTESDGDEVGSLDTEDRGPPSPMRVGMLAIVAAALVMLGVARWTSRDAPVSSPDAASATTTTPSETSSAGTKAAPVEPTSTVSVESTPEVPDPEPDDSAQVAAPEPRPALPSPVRPRPALQPAPKPVASASSSPSAEPSATPPVPRPVDIDGLPIIR